MSLMSLKRRLPGWSTPAASPGDPDNVKITDKLMREMAGVTMADSPLEKPRMVKTGWREGQSFTTEDDPDRMNCPFRGKTG